MNQKPVVRSVYRLFSMILLVSVLFLRMDLSKTLLVQAQAPAILETLSPSYILHSTVELPPGSKDAILVAFERVAATWEKVKEVYVVSLDTYDDWAIGTLLFGSDLETMGANPDTSQLFILHRDENNTWEAAIWGDPRYEELLAVFPQEAIPNGNKSF